MTTGVLSQIMYSRYFPSFYHRAKRWTNLLAEQSQCDLRTDASSRSCRNTPGRLPEWNQLQILIVMQDGVHDVPFILAQNRPHIVVDESGGWFPP